VPKRSVAAVGNKNGQIQDLDARRKITTKTRRSKSNNNNYFLSPVTEFAVTSFDKKENLAPPLAPRGFFFGRMNPWTLRLALRTAPDIHRRGTKPCVKPALH
jgi:hypothetical protein